MVQVISAGAGSGKTYRLNQELMARIGSGETRIMGLFATTFTVKAATELKERVRMSLLENSMLAEAQELSGALIGTVHELGVKLIKRFAYYGGLSPQVNIISDEDRKNVFNQSLSHILAENDTVNEMNALCVRLGLSKDSKDHDWRKEINDIADVIRGNFFTEAVIEESKQKSVQSLLKLLPPVENNNPAFTEANVYYSTLVDNIRETLSLVSVGVDITKDTEAAINFLRQTLSDVKNNGFIPWVAWAKCAQLKVGAKSRSHILDLSEYAVQHLKFPDFQNDIARYIHLIFDLGWRAISEYQTFKKQRGLIDYTDMEVEIRRLISMPPVAAILKSEIDLLLVDEFQDINPIQLDIFLKLSDLAKHSIWVGDPKQSIYGFRYAEPRLMRAVINHFGIKSENILGTSYRSRRDIVNLSNALFLKSFERDIPPEQIVLEVNPEKKELPEQSAAVHHWHFNLDNGGNNRLKPDAEFITNCTAENVAELLKSDLQILPKGENTLRKIKGGDVAILCMTNDQCAKMAKALNKLGVRAAFPRAQLMQEPEIQLISAILHFLLDRRDSLSVAEILRLTENFTLQEIALNRWNFLKAHAEAEIKNPTWHAENNFVQKIDAMRTEVMELSASEIVDTVITQLDLRRRIAAWGNAEQRLQNIEMLRKMATDYEQHCKKMHEAASLNHFLIWLQQQARYANDKQSTGASENAVNILTYHASKGLEFPVTILFSLDKDLRDNIWGLHIETNSDVVDFNDILGNRWIRFWVNPYGNNRLTDTPISEKLEISPEKLMATVRAVEEDARLLYVGITRARDYLVFVSTQKNMGWLNRVWHNGDSDKQTLDPLLDETPFFYHQAFVKKQNTIKIFSKNFGTKETESQKILYIEPYAGIKNFAPRAISNTEPLEQFTKLKPQEQNRFNIYAPLNINVKDTVLQTTFSSALGFVHFLKQPWKPNIAFKKYWETHSDFDLNILTDKANTAVKFFAATFEKKAGAVLDWVIQLPVQIMMRERIFNSDIALVAQSGSNVYLIHFVSGSITSVTSLPNLTELFLSQKAIEQKLSVKPTTFLFDVDNGNVIELEFA